MGKASTVVTFRPAELRISGDVWYISYYAMNPATQKLARKRIKINRIESIKERKKYAKRLIDDINEKLYSGWSPYMDEIAPLGFIPLKDAIDVFYHSKEKELRKDSLRSYKSFILKFDKWLDLSGYSDLYSIRFTKRHALEYMDHIYNVKDISNVTWNNNLRFYRLLFSWLIERQYCTDNNFTDIRKKTTGDKERILIPEETRIQIRDYLKENDYGYLVVCMLIFHALIRPKEITYLKPTNFSLENQTIFLSGAFTKNKKDRVVTIPNSLMPYLQEWDFNLAKNHEYIFGTNYEPGNKPVDSRRFTKKWDKLRAALNLSSKMKLYSLKDSGIVQLLNDGISPEEVMKQADHASLEITTMYTKFANPKGSDQIKNKGSGF